MVQQLRTDEPKYTCVVPVESLTGCADEEIVTFGASALEAKNQAEELLAKNYGCGEDAIAKLLAQAKIEPIAQWCSPENDLI